MKGRNRRVHTLIYYDVAENKLRARITKALKTAGAIRLQKSVYLWPNHTKAMEDTLARQLDRLWQKAAPTDSLIFTKMSTLLLCSSVQRGAFIPFEEIADLRKILII